MTLALLGLLACACQVDPSTPAQQRLPGPPATDKQAMFGSASLVPTREGERARRELAIAAELEQALAQLELGPAHVDVELHQPITAIVIARPRSDRSPAEAVALVAELVHAMIPELAPANLHVFLRPIPQAEPPPPERDQPMWPSMLACLGLGLSIGVAAERLRKRW